MFLLSERAKKAKEMFRKLREQAEWGVKFIGHLNPDPKRIGVQIFGSPVIGTINDISEINSARLEE